MSHDAIADAGVIGVFSKEEETEFPRAYIVPRDPKIITGSEAAQTQFAQEIQAWFRSQVVHYKSLRGGVIVIEALPRSAAGKILRKELRIMAHQDGVFAGSAVPKAKL